MKKEKVNQTIPEMQTKPVPQPGNPSVIVPTPVTVNVTREVEVQKPYVPFVMGVMVVDSFKLNVQDEHSRAMFGLQILGDWNMLDRYTSGATCESNAVLVVSQHPPLARLSTANCEYICDAQGAREVEIAVEAALSGGESLEDAIAAGLRDAKRVLFHYFGDPGIVDTGVTYVDDLENPTAVAAATAGGSGGGAPAVAVVAQPVAGAAGAPAAAPA